MIKDCSKQEVIFDSLITHKENNSVKFEITPLTFNLETIDCFTIYLNKLFFTDYSQDFKYSFEIIAKESILNAFYHGNLNIDSTIKEKENGFEEFDRIVKKKLRQKEYNSRKVYIEIILSKDKVTIIVEDEGNGFNHKNLKIDNYKTYGRGIKLIRINSDKIKWNLKGNKIIIEKKING